jgi:Guanylate-binding protein, N-terminal domain/Guanylate-binding protein, C-terminal domain
MTEPGLDGKKAIPLISYNTNTRVFDVNPVAIEFLKTLQAPIGVISVAGRYRTGKSYLLNRVFLNRRNGFSVGPTVNPCTKGLWVWSSPVTGSTTDGRPCSLVIIDSEGIGALDEDTDHDTRIFSLAVLLSSCFVYNSVGAIDENAISCLSLVVNITKHVHIKSSQQSIQSYSEYFPDFMWVVRDFTLRLVDTNSNPITPKEYLERSLQFQKANENDEKNKIRKHLIEYFKQRDCTTLVRPIEREEDLQNLDYLELNSLRTEFVEQVQGLRNKVLYRIKPKSLNGKELNGEMFGNLITSYVNSMNNGVVPNIESSWTIVCKLQNKKIQDEAKEIYEKTFLDGKKLPMSDEAIKKLHKKAKIAAFTHFNSYIVVEEPKLLSELSEFLSQRYKYFKQENLNVSKSESTNYLKNLYSTVDTKVKQGDINNLLEFDKHMKALEKDFGCTDSGSLKKECFLEFYKEKLLRVSEFFLQAATNELTLHKDLASDHASRIEKELKTISDQLIQEKASFQNSTSAFQSEKSEFQAKEKSLKDQISALMMDRENLENSLRETSDALKYKNQIEIEKATLKNAELAETIKDLERELARKKSEIEEERALMSQKIKLFENNIEELKNKEKISADKFKDAKAESVLNSKSVQMKYEGLIAKLQEKLDIKSHDYKDLEAELDHKDLQIEELKQSLNDLQISSASEKSENLSLIESLQRKCKQKEDENNLKINSIDQEKQNEITKLKIKLEENERKLKHSEEVLRNELEHSNQENAVLSQKIEFLEQELEDHKLKRQEEKRQFDAKLYNLEILKINKVEPNLQKIKAEQSEEISRILKDHETEKIILSSKIEDLIDLKNDLELRLKLERNDFSHKEKQLRDALNEALAAKSKLSLDLVACSVIPDNPKDKIKISELEQQLEQLINKHIEEIESIKSKNEVTISQLRTFFDQEKMRFEQKIIDEKNKFEKRLAENIEEFEEKLGNEKAHHDEEVNLLQEEYAEMENFYAGQVKNRDENLEISNQRVSNLETYIMSLKDQINQLHDSYSGESKTQTESFNTQKIELLKKIEDQSNEISKKDKNSITLKYEQEKLNTLITTKSKEIEDLQSKSSKEKAELTEKLSILNDKYEGLYSDYIKISNKSKRDLALANNEIDLLQKRCKELEDSLLELDRKNKENLESIREDSSIFMNFNLKTLEKEKQILEKKLDEKKKAFKALESLTSKEIAGMERERAVLEEKLSYCDRKRTKIEQYYQEMVNSLQIQLSNKPNNTFITPNSELEGLKLQISKLERDISAKQTTYDRDKSLWENKFNFLVQQRDYSRKELLSAQEKFDQIIEELKKKHSIDREKQENSSNSLISSLENRYNTQMNEMQLRYEQTIKEMRDKNRQNEKSIQNITEELENEKRERSNLALSFEKKIQFYMENEKKYIKELSQEKSNKENCAAQMLEKFSKERDEWRSKIFDCEKKIKELDHQKSQTLVQSEKDRVRLTLEKEEILSKYTSVQQQLNYILKRQEDLKKENDKLKTPRPRAGRKDEAGLSFDSLKYSRAQSGRSTPTNSTTDSPRVKPFNIPCMQKAFSKEDIKDNS